MQVYKSHFLTILARLYTKAIVTFGPCQGIELVFAPLASDRLVYLTVFFLIHFTSSVGESPRFCRPCLTDSRLKDALLRVRVSSRDARLSTQFPNYLYT